MGEKTAIPKLRFTKFPNHWNEIRFGEAFSNSRKKGDDSLPIYSVSQTKGLIPRNSLDRNIQNDAKATQNLRVEPGDLAYNMMRMWQGAIGISDTNCMVSPAYVVLRPKKITDSKFFLYQFERPRSKYLFTAYSHGLTLDRLRLYFDDFSSIRTFVPPLPEQQKIASFLTSADRRIELLQQKKEKLERYKKGVMQQLFTRKIRFKADDGSEFPDWEEKKLGEVGSTFNGLTGKSKENFGSGKPYIQYKQIFDSSKIDTAQFGFVDVGLNEKQSSVQYGDVFFTTSSETPDEIGMASVLMEKVDQLYLNSFCFGYRPNSLDDLVPAFSRFFFRSANVRTEIIKLAQGSTRYNMSKVELMKLSFEIPCTEEQEKISQFLTSQEDLSSIIQEQITQMQTWKKGLLQQMFV